MDMTPADARAMRAIAACSSPKLRSSRRPSAVQRAIADRASENRAKWAERHPEIARAERQLRKQRATMLKRWDHKNDGTPETHDYASRRNQGALARLYQSGGIDSEQLAAAVEIQATAERIAADVAVRTASLETRVDITRHGDGSFHESLIWVRREMAYSRWRCAVQQLLPSGAIGAVLAMIIGDAPGSDPVPFTVVARRCRMHNRRAKQLLIDALDLWPGIRMQVCKEVDQADLDVAHARIA